MIARALKSLGSALRYRSLADELEIERLTAERDHWEAKFKRAASDLEKQTKEIEEWKTLANDLGAIVEATKADAQKWRIARQKRVDAKGGRG
jgi:hypothetical protein